MQSTCACPPATSTGIFYAWGSTPTHSLSEAPPGSYPAGPDYSFRYLVRFGQLGQLVPSSSTGVKVLSAELGLTFVNWGASASVQGCFLNKAWSATPSASTPR